MYKINKTTVDQANRLFEIMVNATEVGCASFYPDEIINIWHKGRSIEGMAGAISKEEFYSMSEDGFVIGFLHVTSSELVGLFIDPNYHDKGYGTKLFNFAKNKISERPFIIKSTLNAVPFYEKLGCRKIRTESMRRHEHDIYYTKMESV